MGMKSSMIASLRFARRVASGTLQVCCCSRMLSRAPFRLLHLSLINACESEHAAAKGLNPGSCCYYMQRLLHTYSFRSTCLLFQPRQLGFCEACVILDDSYERVPGELLVLCPKLFYLWSTRRSQAALSSLPFPWSDLLQQ